jgi:serine/threonine protein phosphatase 1
MTEKYKRVIGIGDTHGCFDLLKALIVDQIHFNPQNDLLVVLGDMIDRGKDSMKVCLFLMELKEKCPDNVVLLRGNHEDICHAYLTQKENDYFYSRWYGNLWMENGGQATIKSFGGLNPARKILIPFIESLELYFETDSHIFVHGGIPRGKNLRTARKEELLWNRSLSYEGSKNLIIGHTPQAEVTRAGNVICIDTGAYSTGVLTGFDILNNRVYQTLSMHEYEIVFEGQH